jgi:hypothetical protein
VDGLLKKKLLTIKKTVDQLDLITITINNKMAKFDTLVIELQKNNKSVASISIKKTDLDMLMNTHGHSRSDIIEDMISTMEENLSQEIKSVK